jgi:hypothetical protein
MIASLLGDDNFRQVCRTLSADLIFIAKRLGQSCDTYVASFSEG